MGFAATRLFLIIPCTAGGTPLSEAEGLVWLFAGESCVVWLRVFDSRDGYRTAGDANQLTTTSIQRCPR